MKTTFKILIEATLFSMILFFAVSFLTVLKSIYPPLGYYNLEIGFPFKYYYQFLTKGDLHHGFDGKALVWDCVLFWTLTVSIFFILKNRKNNI